MRADLSGSEVGHTVRCPPGVYRCGCGSEGWWRQRKAVFTFIHADYQGQVAVYAIADGAVLSGSLPPRKHKLVVAWIEIHQEDLMADWELAVNGKTPFPIKGLDQ